MVPWNGRRDQSEPELLKNSHEPYVVIASGDGVYKLDFNKVLEYHIAKRADVTVVCTDSKEADTSRFGVLKMNEDCRIEEFEENRWFRAPT